MLGSQQCLTNPNTTWFGTSCTCKETFIVHDDKSTCVCRETTVLDNGLCKVVPICGNGLFQPANNEQCDDGNLQDSDGCSSTCNV